MTRHRPRKKITTFNFEPGTLISGKYEVIELLGSGWEGEVYFLHERGTSIERAGKFFFPHRNPHHRRSRFHARTLHKLRHCSVIIPYHVQDTIEFMGHRVVYQLSEYVEGHLLQDFLAAQPKGALPVFQGLHLLHALSRGLEQIHALNEYHGDIHSENIIIRKFGLGFDLKVLDLFHWGPCRRSNQQDDIIDVIRVFYDAIGGQERYRFHPPVIKSIICGLKRGLIIKRFPTAARLSQYIEVMEWE